jgi:hypothetical protein
VSARRSPGPFRDGTVHVQNERCRTCIFRPGGFAGLMPGRRAGMVLDARDNDSVIVCHETYDTDHAVCRGYFDLPRRPPTLELAVLIGIITYDRSTP